MGVVTAGKPQMTGIADLLAQIQPRPSGSPPQPNSFPSLLVTLLTPSYAQHAHSDEAPLHVLRQLGANPTASKPLDAITAVVDRLPARNSMRTGSEGIAYAFVPNPAPLDVSSQALLQHDAQKPGSITIRLPRDRQTLATSIQLPLASTIFHNGLPSTLVHTRYQFDPLDGSLRKSASVQLESQSVFLPLGTDNHVNELRTPLVPLTPMRQVANSYGNIVQKLSKREDDSTGAAVESESRLPASQELEQAVSKYFTAVGLDPQPVEVWALITPDITDLDSISKASRPSVAQAHSIKGGELEKLWHNSLDSERDFTRGTVNSYLRQGGRLAKVLSGGGGWGKKAGLLSLDPDTTYTTRHLRSERGWDIDLDDETSNSIVAGRANGSFGDVVSAGDWIMFFIAVKSGLPHASESLETSRGNHQIMTFGSIPSTIDDMPQTLEPSDKDANIIGTGCEHSANTFGLLSEGGMAVQLYQEDGSVFSRTKADAPFTSWTVTASEDNTRNHSATEPQTSVAEALNTPNAPHGK